MKPRTTASMVGQNEAETVFSSSRQQSWVSAKWDRRTNFLAIWPGPRSTPAAGMKPPERPSFFLQRRLIRRLNDFKARKNSFVSTWHTYSEILYFCYQLVVQFILDHDLMIILEDTNKRSRNWSFELLSHCWFRSTWSELLAYHSSLGQGRLWVQVDG